MKSILVFLGVSVLVLTTLVFPQVSPLATDSIIYEINNTLLNLPFYIYALLIAISGIFYFLMFFYFTKIFLGQNN